MTNLKNLPEWHQFICSRENYKCRVCGKDFSAEYYFQEDNNGRVNQYVCGHHYPHTQKERPDLRLDPRNGVCICRDCHAKAHAGTVQIPPPPFVEEVIENVDVNTGEIFEEEEAKPKNKLVTKNRLPNGQKVRLHAGEKLCKCGFVAQPISGVCMACEKRNPPNFKEEEQKKNKKRAVS